LVAGATDRESVLNSTSTGKHGDAIAFRGLDRDLQCDQISVSFADDKGEMHIVDLQERGDVEITRINFTCNAVAGTQILIEVGATG